MFTLKREEEGQDGSGVTMLMILIFSLAKTLKVDPKEFAENFKTQTQTTEYTAEFAKACIDLEIMQRKEKTNDEPRH